MPCLVRGERTIYHRPRLGALICMKSTIRTLHKLYLLTLLFLFLLSFYHTLEPLTTYFGTSTSRVFILNHSKMDTTPTMSRHTSTWCDICFNLNYTIAKSVPESTVPTPPGNCNPMFLFKEPTSSSCDFCKFLTGVIDTFCPNRNDRKLNIILLENGRIEVTFLSNLRSIEVSRLPGKTCSGQW